jgi:type VI secretion system protein ImpK
MHACLSLGFEGIHRTSAGGAGTLQAVRRDLYETIRRAQPRAIEELSPHWRGQTLPLTPSRSRVPVWSIAALAALLLLGTYIILRNLLSDGAEAVASTLAGAHPDTPVTIARAAPVPPPPPPPPPPPDVITQLQRIRTALAPEIVDGTVTVDQTATSIVIRIANLALFQSGKAEVMPAFKPIASRIAETLDKEPGEIRVDGHSDNVPIRTAAFASNFELSEARAKSVAALLRQDLADPARLRVKGMGAESPVASNKTEDGRAKNRRVELSIPRAD